MSYTMHLSNSNKSRRHLALIAVLGGIAVAGFLLLSTHESPAQPQVASSRNVSKIVTYLLKREHLSKRDMDDEISRRGLKTYIRQLDPFKLYFLQADIDDFHRHQDQLDDFVKAGDVSLARRMYDRFLERLDQRIADVDRLLAMEHDFSADENMATDPDDLEYASDEAALYDRWRKRIKYELLVRRSSLVEEEEEKRKKKEEAAEATDGEGESSENAEEDENANDENAEVERAPKTSEDIEKEIREKIARRYRSAQKIKHQTDDEELLEIFLTSLTSSYDPHTTYMSRSNLENFHINMKLNLEGIGAALSMDDGYTVVTKIIPGGAADKANELKPEDRIVSVGQGEEGDMVDVIDRKLGDVVDLIRGRAGTVVRLGVMPASSEEVKIYSITRARIELKDSEARGEVVEAGGQAVEQDKAPDGSAIKIGVIDLPSFYMDMSRARKGLTNFKSTTRDVRRILEDFKAEGVEVVVLDLSRNGGGSLTEAINLTGLFVDSGPVVQVKDSAGHVQHYDDLDRGMAWDGPLVVLVSKFSASASEILAGAIQDYRRGIIVGDETTHGKGTVQSLLDLGSKLVNVPDPPKLGALKITMQQFYRPNGDSTQLRGVFSDVKLPSLTSQMDIGESDLHFAMDFDRVDPADFNKVDDVTIEILNELEARSVMRRRKSKEFQRLSRNIRRYRDQKDRKSVTLNEQEFLDQRRELSAEKEEEKEIMDHADFRERPVVTRNFYFNEVLDIATDYARMIAHQPLAKLN